MVIKGYPSSTTSNVIAFLLQFRKFEIPCHRFIPNSSKNPLFSPRDCSELRGGTKERHARSPIPRSSRHSSIRQISFASIDPLSFCNFILRNLSYSSASNRIEASLVCNTHANTRHVGRRSLLRFNGCIKLIQIYIPGPIHARKRDARTSWQGAVDPPLPSSLPLLTTLLLHCVSVYTRGCGFIIQREREREREDPDKGDDISFSREKEGQRGLARELWRRLTFFLAQWDRHYASLAPIFAQFPGGSIRNGKGFAVHLCDSQESWEKSARLVSRGTAAFDQTLMGYSRNSLVQPIETLFSDLQIL